MTAEEFADAIGRVLAGAELRAVGRSAGTGVVELIGPGGGAVAIHIQCPFRLVREERILLGSDDMNVSERSDPNAFDKFETFFDSRSTAINELIAKFGPTVSDVTVRSGGWMVIVWKDLRLEVFPNSSGSQEAWRIFEPLGNHYVYPENPV